MARPAKRLGDDVQIVGKPHVVVYPGKTYSKMSFVAETLDGQRAAFSMMISNHHFGDWAGLETYIRLHAALDLHGR